MYIELRAPGVPAPMLCKHQLGSLPRDTASWALEFYGLDDGHIDRVAALLAAAVDSATDEVAGGAAGASGDGSLSPLLPPGSTVAVPLTRQEPAGRPLAGLVWSYACGTEQPVPRRPQTACASPGSELVSDSDGYGSDGSECSGAGVPPALSLRPGDAVVLAPGHAAHADAAQGVLLPGETGVVVRVDSSTTPVLVKHPSRAETWWYRADAVLSAGAAPGARPAPGGERDDFYSSEDAASPVAGDDGGAAPLAPAAPQKRGKRWSWRRGDRPARSRSSRGYAALG